MRKVVVFLFALVVSALAVPNLHAGAARYVAKKSAHAAKRAPKAAYHATRWMLKKAF